MKTKLQRITRGWHDYFEGYSEFIFHSILGSMRSSGSWFLRGYSYNFLKGVLGTLRDSKYKDLGRLGLFMTPSPNGDEQEESYTVGAKSHWYPFKPIPDVKDFEVELNAYDPLFAMFGLRKRFSPKIKFTKYVNKRHNRYMEHCLRRLEDARIGKIAVESDFTTYQLIESSSGNVLGRYKSLKSCASAIFNEDTVSSIALSKIHQYLSQENFEWNDMTVHLTKWFDEKKGLEETYESVEKEHLFGIRVRRHKPNPTLYFRIVDSLIKHSRVFFVRQLMMTEKKWHRDIPYHKIRKWGHAHRRIAREASCYFDKTAKGAKRIPILKYHRTYIPKANGKLRPLGVPSYPWRIYLAQGNKFLLKGVKGRINIHQHAYQPCKSVITVGQDIMENIVDKRNIYSGDLLKYFDNIRLSSAMECLETKFEVPHRICYCLRRMHEALPVNIGKNLSQDPLKYNKHIRVPFGTSGLHSFSVDNTSTDRMSDVAEGMHLTVPSEETMTDGIQSMYNKGFYLRPGMMKAIDEAHLSLGGRGIPQGGSLSPLLAILLQESKYFPQLEAQKASYVQYSDDVIAASNDDTGIPRLSVESHGIMESKEKSFGVKKNGEGLKPLDFCGLRYDGVRNLIIANTRAGSRLELKDVNGLIPLLAFRELLSMEQRETKFDDLSNKEELDNWADSTQRYIERRWSTPKNEVKHKVWGLLQSRLFSGSGELENYEQDFRLTAKKGSLVSMHYKHLKLEKVNVFTSTSGAFPMAVADLGLSRRKSLQRGRLKSIKEKSN